MTPILTAIDSAAGGTQHAPLDDFLSLTDTTPHAHLATLRRLLDAVALTVTELTASPDIPVSALDRLRSLCLTIRLSRHGMLLGIAAVEAALGAQDASQLALWQEVRCA